MENLLFKRLKALGSFISGPFAFAGLAVLAAVLYLFLFRQPHPDNAFIQKAVLADFKSVEAVLASKITEYKQRAESIFDGYEKRQLVHSVMEPREALIITQNGYIKDYYGEIYYFKAGKMENGDWSFIERRENLFFMRKMAEDIFYVRYWCDLQDNFILDGLKFNAAVKELKLFKEEKSSDTGNVYQYDEVREMFFYSHLLEGSNNQLGLFLRFSQKDIRDYYERRERLFLFAVVFLFLFLGIVYFYKRKKPVSRVLWFALLLELFIFVSRSPGNNFFLAIGNKIVFDSIYEVLIILTGLVSLVYWVGVKIKPKILSYFLFNFFTLLALMAGNVIFSGVNFKFTEFSVLYLALISVLFALHLIPVFTLRGWHPQPPCTAPGVSYAADNISNSRISGKLSQAVGRKGWHPQPLRTTPMIIGGVFLFQAAVVIAGYYLFKINVVNTLMLSLAACLLLFFEKRYLVRAAVLFLVAISIYSFTGGHALSEKKEFIADGLKNIFLNQNNYAKFIAREIVHELNLESGHFYEFFDKDASARLKTIWKKSMASRENIASGIFVLSPEGNILSQYSYQMEFLNVETQTIFPFWAIEDTQAELYGEKTPLSVASINVVRESRHWGRIIVQVLNLPQLILRHQDKVNIFTIDNKIDGMDLSYIKLSEENQIVENPSNINLENVAGILKFNDQWITFRFIDIVFNGYIFKHEKDTFIIFFPANKWFTDFSEIVKIFIFLLVMFFLFYFRDLKKVEWRSIYYSFSIRVFGILILISLLTAVIFSLFSLNFNSQSSLRQSRQIIYEKGRTAQNIGYNFLEEGDEFTPGHLLLISRILNADVSVYRKGGLLETSNYRKIVDYHIPNFLHSNILQLLNRKNQKFVLLDEPNGFRLYFKIYDYILDVEFSYTWRKILSEESYYTNFIITMFFILAVIGFSFAFFFRNKILSPIEGLNRGMAEVEKGNLPQLKKIPSEIEIKKLYMGFNSMIEGIREQRKNISELSRMKTIIKLGRRVAHEVKNPLTPIKLSAEQILRTLKDKNPNYEDIIKQSVKYIIDETEHLKKVSYGFLDLSRLDELNVEPFDLVDVLRGEVFNYKQIYGHIDFDFFVGDVSVLDGDRDALSCFVVMDKFKIRQVLKNLINNSIEAVGDKKGVIRIALTRGDGRVTIEVVDNGVGMDEEGMDLIFNFDYSTKEIGTGLGLFIVKRIIELHRGRIDIQSEENKGTKVILDLPVRIE